MKQLITIISILALVSGCNSVGGAVAVINPLNFTTTGFYPLLIIGELETNLSSLVIDKTRATVADFNVNPFEVLPEKSLIFVMPAIITKSYQKTYDTYYSSLVSRYLQMNNFAVITNDISKADFILMTNIAESPERRTGTNSSVISISIMEQDERAVFYSNVVVNSKSDKNFYYYPSKAARPVQELTLLGFEELFKAGLPQAFGTVR